MLIYLEKYQGTTTSIGTGTAIIDLVTCSPCTSFLICGISLSCARGALTAYISLHYDCRKVMTNLRAIATSLSEILQLDAKIPSQNLKVKLPQHPKSTHRGVVLLPTGSFTTLEVQRGNAALDVKQGTACQTF